MLVLYQAKTTSFNNLGLGILTDFYSDPLITEVLNGEYNLEFEYLIGGKLSELIVEQNIIKAKGQLFRIKNIEKDTVKIKVLAKHVFFDLENNFLLDVAPTNKTSQEALLWILNNAEMQTNFSVTGNCTDLASARYVRKNIIEAIYSADNSLLTRFGGELEINNFNITVHKKRGSNLGLEIRQGKNLSAISFKLDFSTVATRIMPQGKDELLLEEKYVDSPIINNYIVPIYKKIEFPNAETRDELIEGVNKLYANGIDKPTISISIDFIELSKTDEYKNYSYLETAHLGDTCKAIIPSLNLNYSTRIVKTVYNCNLERTINIELGIPTPNYITNQNNTLNNLKNQVSKINPDSILKEAKENATELINHPFNGYIYISESTGEMYLCDSTDIETSQKIWKFGLGGIGYSSKGINGTYETAITANGEIVADFITAGTMSVERIQGLSNRLDGMEASILLNNDTITIFTEKLNSDVYTKTQVNKLIVDAESGLTNIFTQSGGSNLLRNTAPWYMKSENTAEFWNGNLKQIVEPEATSGYAILIQNGTISQSVSLPTGTYSVSFKYKKLINASEGYVRYNGKTFNLTETSGEIHSSGEITNNQFIIEINSNTNDSFEIYDLILKHGSEGIENMLVWTQNANESRSDTVQISEGITATSSATDTKATMDSAGFIVRNKTTGTSVMESTKTGGKFLDLISTGNSNISGLLVKKQGSKIIINGESGN